VVVVRVARSHFLVLEGKMNDTHMIGLYATFVFMIFLAVLPYFVIKYIKKRGRDGISKD